jgi:hypothetical protein
MFKWSTAIAFLVVVSMFSLALAEDAPSPTKDQEIAELQSQLLRALNRIDDLEKRVTALETQLAANGNAQAQPSGNKNSKQPKAMDQAPLDSQWAGSLKDIGQTGSRKATASVTARNGDRFSLKTEIETGEIWVWSLAVDGDDIRVIEMTRLRARQGVAAPPGTGGITGSGSFKNGVLTLSFTWPQGTNTYRGVFSLRKQ